MRRIQNVLRDQLNQMVDCNFKNLEINGFGTVSKEMGTKNSD